MLKASYQTRSQDKHHIWFFSFPSVCDENSQLISNLLEILPAHRDLYGGQEWGLNRKMKMTLTYKHQRRKQRVDQQHENDQQLKNDRQLENDQHRLQREYV